MVWFKRRIWRYKKYSNYLYLIDIYNIDQLNIKSDNEFLKITDENIEKFQNQLFKDEYKDVLEYLVDECKISCETLQKYSVGACDGVFYKNNNEKISEKCVLFPYVDYNNYKIKKVRLVSIEDKSNEKYIMSSENESVFGWNKCIYY